jgi:hypothetical protein
MEESNRLGPTILEVLNCGFHKQKVRNQSIFRKRKTTATRATVQYRSHRELDNSEKNSLKGKI